MTDLPATFACRLVQPPADTVAQPERAAHAARPTQVHSVKLVLAYAPESGTFYVRTACPTPP
ncbi:hypothetical protein ACIRQF_05595 [Streptomyces sp. NPDC101191]|uniref:hypothetical protein n=1 Tax=Streptomyces sp. NPDC101191 TaxID=3366126 RepID=UPI00382F45C1